MFTKKHYREKYKDALKENANLKTEILQSNMKNSVVSSRLQGIGLITESMSETGLSEEDIIKLRVMKELTRLDLSYSNYVTQTPAGRLVVDVTQMPTSIDEIVSGFRSC